MHISPGLDEHTSPPQLFALHISWRVRIRQPFFFLFRSFIHVKFGAIYILERGVFRSHASFFLRSGRSSGILSSWVFLDLCRAFPIVISQGFSRVSPVYSIHVS